MNENLRSASGQQSPYSSLRALVTGLGSMGKRRIRNLHALGVRDITGYDPREDRRLEASQRYGITTVTSLSEGLSSSPSVLIISTPPHRHLEPAWASLEAGIPFFMEANCFLRGLEELALSIEKCRLACAPSRTMWFHPGMRKIKELIDSGDLGRPAEFSHHCGHALPNWHPWEDYRMFYGGQPEARGAGWDMIGFELYMLTWMFGRVSSLSAMFGKLSTYDTPVDDTFQLLLRFESGTLGSAMIDVLAPLPFRSLRIISERGVIEWDQERFQVGHYLAGSDRWDFYPIERGHVEPMYHAAEEMYFHEIEAFLKGVLGIMPYPASFRDEVEIMRLVEAVRVSQELCKHVTFPFNTDP